MLVLRRGVEDVRAADVVSSAGGRADLDNRHRDAPNRCRRIAVRCGPVGVGARPVFAVRRVRGANKITERLVPAQMLQREGVHETDEVHERRDEGLSALGRGI